MTRSIEKGFFTAEDFRRTWSPPMGDDDLQFIANDANRILRDHAEKNWPKSFGLVNGKGECIGFWGRDQLSCDTHTAYLADLREIPK